MSKIVILGSVPYILLYSFYRDIEFSSLYWEYRYVEDGYIGVPL